MLNRDKVVLITGASGMVGGAIKKLFLREGFSRVLSPTREELNLKNENDVDSFFKKNQPSYVMMIGAKVGGINANMKDPVGFVDENLRITINLFNAANNYGSEKNLFMGSSCIYPTGISDLIGEDRLLSGQLEPTNEGYALSKIIGLKLAKYYHSQYGMLTVCPMLCNVYGTGDHFDLQNSHVLSSLVKKFVDARDQGEMKIVLWGTGIAKREFMHCDDAARAALFFMDNIDVSDHINVGWGIDISIKELANIISGIVGFKGEIIWDSSMQNGMLRKCMDVKKMNDFGFAPQVSIREGIMKTIIEYESIKKNEY